MAKLLTAEQDAFLRNNIKGIDINKAAELLNNEFGLALIGRQIKEYKFYHGIKSGKVARVTNSGCFKKGNIPQNYRPVGSERVSKDGYVEIKVKDPRTWELKHVWLWEKTNGERPPNTAIVFLDGDRKNIDLGNLKLITREELLVLNRNKLLSDDKDLNNTGIALSKLIVKKNKFVKARCK